LDAVNAWVRRYRSAPPQRRAPRTNGSRAKATRRRCCAGSDRRQGHDRRRGTALTASSRVLDGTVAPHDATAWARLAPRMVLVGHTHTHEFAAGGTTDQVGNPHDLGRSSAARAALARRSRRHGPRGSVPTRGSVRIPPP